MSTDQTDHRADPVQAVAEALEVHQVEYLMDVRWDCGCNERGHLPTLADALRHQAEAAVAAARPAIAAEAWDEGFTRGFYDVLAGGDRDASESAAENPYRIEHDARCKHPKCPGGSLCCCQEADQ